MTEKPSPDAWLLDGTALSAETYDGEDIEGAEALFAASTTKRAIVEEVIQLEQEGIVSAGQAEKINDRLGEVFDPE